LPAAKDGAAEVKLITSFVPYPRIKPINAKHTNAQAFVPFRFIPLSIMKVEVGNTNCYKPRLIDILTKARA